jgi:hypothetical protein
MTRVVSESLKDAIELSLTGVTPPPKAPPLRGRLRRLWWRLWRRHLEQS